MSAIFFPMQIDIHFEHTYNRTWP